MKWSLFLGRIAGIKIFIHWTFLILLAWITFLNLGQGKTVDETFWTIGFYLTIFLCVFLHELGHALTAKKYGIKTRDITILPIGGVARLENLPSIPRQELWVAIAGPLVNIGIALLIFIITTLAFGNHQEASLVTINSGNFLPNLRQINLYLALFNLIPAFPMDGGRVLRALLSMNMDRAKATKISASVGQFIAIGFVILGFFTGNFILVFIGFFIYLGAQGESGYTQIMSKLRGFTVRDVLMTDYKSLQKTEPLANAVKLLLDSQTTDFLVMEDGKVVGTLNRNEMIKGLASQGGESTVEMVMNPQVKFLNPNISLEEVLPLAQQKTGTFFPVIDDNNRLMGVLDSENILELMMVKEAITH